MATRRRNSLTQDTLAGKALDSWALHGIAVIQSGQPYSIIDYSGAVGSIFYSTFNGITNPIVPLGSGMQPEKRAHRPERRFLQPQYQHRRGPQGQLLHPSHHPAWHHGRS